MFYENRNNNYMTRIAILLTVHNRKKYTLSCLSNIYKLKTSTDVYLDVYLTDDGSTDGTADEIMALYPTVNILKGNGDLYWNGGMYTAWNEAVRHNYDYYLWLNDDTVLIENAVQILLHCAQKSENKAIIVGATHDSNGDFSYGGRLIDGSALFPNNNLVKVDLMNGNIVLITKFIYEQVGLLDPYYRHDKGDTDYSLMATSKGLSIYQAPVFLGSCERHNQMPDWMNPEIRLYNRLKSFHSITGVMPHEVFYFEKKHHNLFRAVKKVLFMYLRCIWPSLVVLIGKESQLYSVKLQK
jgi:GT2 family glycosyltransferase